MTERKWRQPRLQLHLITKSRGRRELGLPTSSAAVLPLKMLPCTMFRSIQTFSVNGKFTERYHIFCARINLLFTIFFCSRYRPWATVRLLHYFGFVMCANSRFYCTHFSCHWRKIRNVSRRLTQISKRQRDPWERYWPGRRSQEVEGKLYLTLHCHHHNDFCIKRAAVRAALLHHWL